MNEIVGRCLVEAGYYVKEDGRKIFGKFNHRLVEPEKVEYGMIGDKQEILCAGLKVRIVCDYASITKLDAGCEKEKAITEDETQEADSVA